MNIRFREDLTPVVIIFDIYEKGFWQAALGSYEMTNRVRFCLLSACLMHFYRIKI